MSLSLGLRLLLLALTTGDAVLGQSPGPNAVAVINGQTSLDCVTTLLALSSWSLTADGTSNPIAISSNCIVIGSNTAYYKTDVIGGNICRLTIANATMQQAGVYDCYAGSGGITYRSLVTVIDVVANVVVNNQSAEVVDNDQLSISCSINYKGASSPAPSLHPSPYWTTSQGQNFTSTLYYPSPTAVTLVATVRVQKPTVPIFHCVTTFEIIGNTIGYNATSPADTFTVGASAELDVQYGASTPAVTSRPEVITINGVPCGISVLTCSSTGNPKPSYKWYDTTQQVFISDEQNLTLAEVNRNYRCDSYNTIRNQLNLMSTTYTVSEDDSVAYLQNCSCDVSSPCVCSQGKGGLALICNAATYPCAAYLWNGTDGDISNSQVYEDVSSNGTYYCAAYFDRSLSNYTGNVNFANGTSEIFVDRCTISVTTLPPTKSSEQADCNCKDVAIAMGVLFGISLAINIAVLILWLFNHLRAKEDPLKRTENILKPETLDPRNGSSEPTAYEDLRRRDDAELQQSNYEKLSPNTTSYDEPNVPMS